MIPCFVLTCFRFLYCLVLACIFDVCTFELVCLCYLLIHRYSVRKHDSCRCRSVCCSPNIDWRNEMSACFVLYCRVFSYILLLWRASLMCVCVFEPRVYVVYCFIDIPYENMIPVDVVPSAAAPTSINTTKRFHILY